MKGLRSFLEPLLVGRPLESGPAGALATAIWVMQRRLDEFNVAVWERPGEFESLFQRRQQLVEDIEALEALHARALGRPAFAPSGPTPPRPGHGYGET